MFVKNNGDILVKNTNPKKILDIYKAICSGKTNVIKELVNDFNKQTKNGNDMSFILIY